MKYTYKYESFFYNKAYKARLIMGAIPTVFGLACLFVGYIAGFIIFAPCFLLSLSAFISARKEYNKWQRERNEKMKNGIRCTGKVVDSGGHKFYEEGWDREIYEDGERFSYGTKTSDWWIEVEYIDVRDGEVKRFKAKNINRNGKALIGRRADVYVNETYIYIDIP